MESTPSETRSMESLSDTLAAPPSSASPRSSCPAGSREDRRLAAGRALLPPAVLQQAAARAAGPCRVTAVRLRAAADDVTGFLGDHFRATLALLLPDASHRTLHLFVKTSSLVNDEKAAFIDQGNYFRRERLLFSLFEELGGGDADGEAGWHVEVLLHLPRVLVMCDAAARGYRTRPVAAPFDGAHLRVGAAALARYHAAMANYSVRKGSPGRPYDIASPHTDILQENNYKDCPWLRAAARLDADLVHTFSTRYGHIPNLRDSLERLFIEACASLRPYCDTLNVLIHKDAWANNVLFRYDKGVPVHALLIDYQCVRYAPPAFDLMIFIYLNTTRETRTQLEQEVIEYYYKEFDSSLERDTKDWLCELEYDLCSVREWCSRARMFALVAALAIFPYTLMDGRAATLFDDPATFRRLSDCDRAPPVIHYATTHPHYRDTQLLAAEEFIQRYLVGEACQ